MAPAADWAHLTWTPTRTGAWVSLRGSGRLFGASRETEAGGAWKYSATRGYDWTGYRLDLFGACVAGPLALDGAPYCQFVIPDDDPDADGFLHWSHRGSEPPIRTVAERVLWIRLWEQRAYVGATPLYAEVRWHPTEGQVHSVCYPAGYTPASHTRRRGWTALAHLEDTAQTSTLHRPGPPPAPAGSNVGKLVKAVHRLCGDTKRPGRLDTDLLTQLEEVELAPEVNRAPRTVRQWLQDAEYPSFDAFKQAIARGDYA